MKNIIKGSFLTIALMLSVTSAYAEKFIMNENLAHDRTSMDYAIEVREFVNNIENYYWEAPNGEGYHFTQAEKPYDDPLINENVFLNIEAYYYGEKTGSSLVYLVKGKWAGFLDVIDFSNRSVYAFRYNTDEGVMQVLKSSRELQTFKRVKHFSENPNPKTEIPSAEELGLVF